MVFSTVFSTKKASYRYAEINTISFLTHVTVSDTELKVYG